MNISITNFSRHLVSNRSERQRGGSGERRDKRHGERKNWGVKNKNKKKNKGVKEKKGDERRK